MIEKIKEYKEVLSFMAMLLAMGTGFLAYFAKAQDLDATNAALNEFKKEVYTNIDEQKLEQVEDDIIDLELKGQYRSEADELRLKHKIKQKERILRRLDNDKQN